MEDLYALMYKQGLSGDLIFLGKDVLGYDWIDDELHELPARFLIDGEFHDKMWMDPRGSLKSTFANVILNLWKIIRNPNITILLGAEGMDRNEKWIRQMKTHMERNQLFRALYGDLVNPLDWQQQRFTVKTRTNYLIDIPTVSSASIEQPKTGDHYDDANLDDVVVLRNSDTFEQREKASRFIDFVDTLLRDTSQKLVTGTFYHFQDAYWRRVQAEADKVEHGEPRTTAVLVRGVYDEEMMDKKGKSRFTVLPTLSERVLVKMEAGDPQIWATQYMLNPVAGVLNKFKPEWIKYYRDCDLKDEDPQTKVKTDRILNVFTVFDPGEGQTRRASYSAIVTIGVDCIWRTYVLDARRGRWEANEVINNFFDVYMTFNPLVFGLETIAFQSWLKRALDEESVKRNMFLPITELDPSTTTTKEYEILSLTPWFVNGKVFFKINMNDIISEFISYPKGSNDYVRAFSYFPKIIYVPGMNAKGPFQDNRIISETTGYPVKI
jgi:hypothetical protein